MASDGAQSSHPLTPQGRAPAAASTCVVALALGRGRRGAGCLCDMAHGGIFVEHARQRTLAVRVGQKATPATMDGAVWTAPAWGMLHGLTHGGGACSDARVSADALAGLRDDTEVKKAWDTFINILIHTLPAVVPCRSCDTHLRREIDDMGDPSGGLFEDARALKRADATGADAALAARHPTASTDAAWVVLALQNRVQARLGREPFTMGGTSAWLRTRDVRRDTWEFLGVAHFRVAMDLLQLQQLKQGASDDGDALSRRIAQLSQFTAVSMDLLRFGPCVAASGDASPPITTFFKPYNEQMKRHVDAPSTEDAMRLVRAFHTMRSAAAADLFADEDVDAFVARLAPHAKCDGCGVRAQAALRPHGAVLPDGGASSNNSSSSPSPSSNTVLLILLLVFVGLLVFGGVVWWRRRRRAADGADAADRGRPRWTATVRS